MTKRTRKRKNNSSTPDVKRVKLTDLTSDIDEQIGNDLDFRCFLREPQIPFDITVANKTSEFLCHKNILMKISSVFQDLLKGDKTAKVLRLDDISDTNLKMFQKLIYARACKRGEVLTLNANLEDMLNIIPLASKYAVNFMDDALQKCLTETHLKTGDNLGLLWNTLQQHNLLEHAKIVSKVHSSPRHDCLFDSLSGIPSEILVEMAKRSHPVYESKFAKLVKHAVCLSYISNDTRGIQAFKAALKDKMQNSTPRSSNNNGTHLQNILLNMLE